MDNWANFLKKQAENRQVPILDTTSMDINEIVKWFMQFIRRQGLDFLQTLITNMDTLTPIKNKFNSLPIF